MKTYIAFLRGINVGGQKKILMADLRRLLEGLGFQNVRTYIQSGNVIFSTSEGEDLSTIISESIENEYGWKVPVLIKKPSELVKIVSKCPFFDEKRVKSYFILLKTAPAASCIKVVQEYSNLDEEFYIHKDCIYIYYKVGAGKAKMGNNFFEKKLDVQATARNYRTMFKMIELI